MNSPLHDSSPTSQQDFGAHATVVNRVHRVVRAEALEMQQQRNRRRSLLAPLAIASVLLLAICYAAWNWLEVYSAALSAEPSAGAPDASAQLLVLMLWSLPVTAALIGFVWLRRPRVRSNEELPQ